MSPIRLCLGVAVAACGLLSSGCDRSVAPPTGTPEPASPAVKQMGMGLSPQRGPAQVMPPGAVAVEFEPQKMDFGVLTPGAAVQGTSRLWNVGSSPLTITNSITSCGCTSTENLAGRVVPPGGYTEFTTDMHMKSGLGPKTEKITVYFGPNQVAIQFYNAEVSLPIRLTPPYLSASERINDRWVQTQTGEITVSAPDGRPFRIIGAHEDLEAQIPGIPAAGDDGRCSADIGMCTVPELQGGKVDARELLKQVPRSRPLNGDTRDLLGGVLDRHVEAGRVVGEPFETRQCRRQAQMIVTEVEHRAIVDDLARIVTPDRVKPTPGPRRRQIAHDHALEECFGVWAPNLILVQR